MPMRLLSCVGQAPFPYSVMIERGVNINHTFGSSEASIRKREIAMRSNLLKQKIVIEDEGCPLKLIGSISNDMSEQILDFKRVESNSHRNRLP